jgi:hypothetical protein
MTTKKRKSKDTTNVCCKHAVISHGVGIDGEVTEASIHCPYTPEIDYTISLSNKISEGEKEAQCTCDIENSDGGNICCGTTNKQGCPKHGKTAIPPQPQNNIEELRKALEEIGNRVGSPVTDYDCRVAVGEYQNIVNDISRICKSALRMTEK